LYWPNWTDAASENFQFSQPSSKMRALGRCEVRLEAPGQARVEGEAVHVELEAAHAKLVRVDTRGRRVEVEVGVSDLEVEPEARLEQVVRRAEDDAATLHVRDQGFWGLWRRCGLVGRQDLDRVRRRRRRWLTGERRNGQGGEQGDVTREKADSLHARPHFS
jgi:hypothetical protein